ncbi:hypothetical protein VTK56DRAFT_10082 [Thermocarpiscus australiensis]
MDPGDQPQPRESPTPNSDSSNSSDSDRSPQPHRSQEEDDMLSQPAYLLEWDHKACRRTALATPDALRAALDSPGRQRLLVLHGLRQEFVDVVLAANGDMDLEFVESHAARRTFRPRRLLRQRARRRRGEFEAGDTRSWHVWEYPEVVERLDASGAVRGEDADLGSSPPIGRLPVEGEKLMVIFCRASLWRGVKGDVLFLDKPMWKDSEAGLRKTRRKRATIEKLQGDGESDDELDRDETSTLEDVVLDALTDGWESDGDLAGVLSEVVYDRWLELFDYMGPPSPDMSEEKVACYWQILRSLELNEEVVTDLDWTRLLSRIQRRIALLPGPRTKRSALPPAFSRETTGTTSSVSRKKSIRSTGTVNPSLKSASSRQRKDQTKPVDENRRALDRISYLGGILIPLPIVSGILSMEDAYGPEGNRFWVFWAVAIPMSLLTALLIYADTIRKAEVWVPIAADRVVPSHEVSGDGSKEDIGPVDVQVKRHRTVTWRKHDTDGAEEQQQATGRRRRADEVFYLDQDMEERMVGMPSTAAAAAAEAGEASDEEVAGSVLDWLPAAPRWATRLVSVPPVILEQPADGTKPKAWKRKELGWYGAVKAIVYKRPRAGSDIPDGVPASEMPGRRKTQSI